MAVLSEAGTAKSKRFQQNLTLRLLVRVARPGFESNCAVSAMGGFVEKRY